MVTDWREIVTTNKNKIIQAAQRAGESEPVCAIFDLEEARAGNASASAMQLITGTGLKEAVPLTAPQCERRIVCLPVSREKLLETLEPHEDISELRGKLRTGGTLNLWVVCFEGENRSCYDIHITSPEHN